MISTDANHNLLQKETTMYIKINTPNDYGSEADQQAAIDECYDGDADACEADGGEKIFDLLDEHAHTAGLCYVRQTDYGAIWMGEPDQYEKLKELLPSWAKDYTSVEV